jgi:hypothetical protein
MFLTPTKQSNLLNKKPTKVGEITLCDNFLNIKKYFNNLNQDQSHFYNSNDICTFIEFVKARKIFFSKFYLNIDSICWLIFI